MTIINTKKQLFLYNQLKKEQSMDKQELTNEILYKIQSAFPLTKRPFLELAKELNVSEDEILNIIKEQKEQGIIRQTSAIFDTKRLGYKSSLVAFKVSPQKIEQAAKVINSHPGVSHNYLREHDFNIWFTLAVAPDSKLGLERTIDILKEQSGAYESIILPTLKLFKISVKMDTTGKGAKKEKVAKRNYKELKLTPKHIEAIKELQKDIELVNEPFLKTTKKLGISYDELFTLANELKEAGVMRRFAAILRHRKAGFNANAMTVWEAPKEKAQELGKQLASFSAVSHCYLRPSYPNWPYNLFAMVHAKTEEESESIIAEMAKETGLTNYKKLYSTREFKKQRIIYFSDEFEKWEKQYI